jgi:DNA-binding PadR family transcriptional regulator
MQEHEYGADPEGPPFRRGFRGGPEHWGGDWGGRPRKRRGDIRTAILTVLQDHPGHGYEVMRTLEERSGGMWRPSPGSVYPTLQLLEDEGFVRSQEIDGRRVYELTDTGRTEATERAQRAGGPPWRTEGGDRELWGAFAQLVGAMKQIGRGGTPEQRAAALEIITNARKALYQLLAS